MRPVSLAMPRLNPRLEMPPAGIEPAHAV